MLDLVSGGDPRRAVRPNPESRLIGVDRLVPNPRNPRETFAPDSLAELARSIRDDGILQPILVRPLDDGAYEIVAGERRYRAARDAGLAVVPCVVRRMDAATADVIALVENIHREELDPGELLVGLRRLRDDYPSLRAISARIHKPIDWISNRLGPLTDDLTAPHVLAGALSLTAAEEVTRAPEEIRPHLLDVALGGAGKGPLRELRQAYERGELPTRPAVGQSNGDTGRVAALLDQLRRARLGLADCEHVRPRERQQAADEARLILAWAEG